MSLFDQQPMGPIPARRPVRYVPDPELEAAGIDPDVAPEKVDSYELGIKSQWFDRKLTLNLAGYWTEISDYQTAITEQVPNTVNVRQYIANIPGVRSRGVEADLKAGRQAVLQLVNTMEAAERVAAAAA